ncbi:RNA-binding protein 2 [Euphorbia peplus]|nr:RNA-binding protein 2 [Euphorbia peplus]
MTDGYWNRPQQHPLLAPGPTVKRPRPDYDHQNSGMPTSNEMPNYFPREDDRSRFQAVKDTKTIGSAYDRYLQNAKIAPFSSGEASGINMGQVRPPGVGLTGLPILDSGMAGRPRASIPDLVPNGRDMGFGGPPPMDTLPRPVRETMPLPHDASSTLYVEGLPSDCRRREVAHIFRPFVGYKEVRLVSKESKHRGGDPIILCFVDFESAACAATAMSALQDYKMDEHDRESNYLRLQFSRHPGPRSGPSNRGKREQRMLYHNCYLLISSNIYSIHIMNFGCCIARE